MTTILEEEGRRRLKAYKHHICDLAHATINATQGLLNDLLQVSDPPWCSGNNVSERAAFLVRRHCDATRTFTSGTSYGDSTYLVASAIIAPASLPVQKAMQDKDLLVHAAAWHAMYAPRDGRDKRRRR